VTSADAHPVAGSFLFQVGDAPAAGAGIAAIHETEADWRPAVIVNRGVQLAASMIAAGGVLFLLLFRAGDAAAWCRARPCLGVAASLAAASALVAVGLQGALLTGAPPSGLLDAEVWRVGLASTRGAQSAVAIGGLAALAFGVLGRRSAVAALGVLALLASFVLSGHAATAAPRFVAWPSLLVHAALAAFWIGSFLPLLRALEGAPAEAAAALRRFSRLAVIGVPLLLAAGLVLAVLQVEQLPALTASVYGRVLLAKLALAAVLLGLAALNRLRLAPLLDSGHPGAARSLRITIGCELAISLAILAATAILSQTVPPRSLAMHDHASHDHHDHHQGGAESLTVEAADRTRRARIEFTPGRVGHNTIAVRLTDAAGLHLAVKEVKLELSNPAAGIEPMRRVLAPDAEGVYGLAGSELAIAGRWTIRVEALVTDFEKAAFEAELDVK
jgi:copper transport protein